ncbi:MAG: PAS domain-containing protein [Betaproteobacteria bacterium]|nr:PAS domain-containing protein [Betaproteobacteria bacterium]
MIKLSSGAQVLWKKLRAACGLECFPLSRNSQRMPDHERLMLRILVDHMPEDIFTLDTDGRFTMVNTAWLVEHGYASDKGIIGRTVFDVFDAETAAHAAAENKSIMETGLGRYNQSREVPRPGGGNRSILINKVPMRDAQGRVLGIIGIIRDVTELKSALDNLRQERNLLRSIIDSSPDAIHVKDRAGRYVIMNKATMRLRNVASHADVVGKTAYDFFPETSAAAIEAEDRAIMNTDRPLLECQRKSREPNDPDRWVSMSKLPLHDGEGAVAGLVTINRDITNLKNVIEEARSLNAQLEDRVRIRTLELQEANKELEAFSYSVSHDLRAPLRSISGFGNFLLKDNYGQLDAAGKGRLNRILAASERMGKLIDDLLKLARISRQSISYRKVDLHALAAEVVAALRDASPERLVEVILERDLTVEADAGLMRVVLENLLGNAWKFTAKRPDARIELGAAVVDGRREFFVRDNGAGFDMVYAGKLFAPFQRMHSQHQFEGTGIGLATVKRIIERHLGRIWIDSAVNQGTTVSFTISAAGPVQTAAEAT